VIQKDNKLAISTPYQYIPDGGSSKWHQGIVHTSNILKIGNYYYMWAQSSVGNKDHPQKGRMCLYRTQTLENSKSWRGAGPNSSEPFSSEHFSVSNVDPYPQQAANPSAHICSANPSLKKLRVRLWSWTYNTVLKRYIAIGIIPLKNNPSYSHQVVAVTSKDGYNLSNKQSLLPINYGLKDLGTVDTAYCSIIDPNSPHLGPDQQVDRNYQYSGANPWIICVQMLHPNSMRALVVYKVHVSASTGNAQNT
jgi:hypothetical protein